MMSQLLQPPNVNSNESESDLLTLKPDRLALFKIFKDPALRPPYLDEMLPDIDKVVSSIAHRYTDQSCPGLHFDELKSQGYAKLAKLIHDGYLDKLPSRVEFFKLFKTAVGNHIKGLVMKYRFTQKRTGTKAPSREEQKRLMSMGVEIASYKPIEVSLDDEEAALQVSEEQSQMFSRVESSDFDADLKSILTAIEYAVYNELETPSKAAWIIAELDARRGKDDCSISININEKHHAAALGLSLDEYKIIVERIGRKIMDYTNQTVDDELEINKAILELEKVFQVQLPPNLDKVVMRRLFTMAARDQLHKLNDQVKEHLKVVGAKIPELQGGRLRCFGVLYQKSDRICELCAVNKECAVEAHNFGLDEIVLSPKVLGAKQTRTPSLIINKENETTNTGGLEENSPLEMTVVDGQECTESMTQAAAPIIELKEADIAGHLAQHFRGPFVLNKAFPRQTYYRHRDKIPSGKIVWLFRTENISGKLTVLFCNPEKELAAKLAKKGNGYYLPESIQFSECAALIATHAKDKFK